MSVSPPTKVVTVKHQFTITDHNEMLSLAQEKFDDLRKKSREKAATIRYSGSASKIRRRNVESQEEIKFCQLHSSLLYLSLMMHKVEDMKKNFEANSGTLYNEWQTLFESLHSPVFHLRERCMQNERAKKMFNRKQKYKTMFEEEKAKMTKLEESSQQLGHALSKMSEENLKSQAMLEEKVDIKLDLCSTQEKVQQLLESVKRQEGEISVANETRDKLIASLTSVEKEVCKLEQKVHNDETLAIKATIEIVDLNRDVKDFREKLRNKEQELLIVNKERESIQEKLQQQATERELLLGEKDKLLVDRRECNDQLRSAINSLQNEKVELESNFSSKANALESALSQMTMELGIVKVKLQTSREEVVNLRSDLESTSNVLQNALEINRSAQLSQSEMMELQQKEIREQIEMRLSVDLKLAESTSQLKIKTSEYDAMRSQLDGQIMELMEKVVVYQHDISTASALELKQTNERNILETNLSEVSMESKVYAAERDMLEKVLEQMRDSMKKSVHSASQSQENADSKVKETEIHLVSSQMALAKSQVENDVMKARMASQQDISDTMQAKVASEVMSLEETVLKDNKEKEEVSNEMNTITSKCAEEVRAAKEKLVVAELAIKELKLASVDKLAKLLQETDTKHNEEKDGLIKKMSALEADGVEKVMTAKRNQDVAESKVRALELEMGQALAKSQVENDIMKARMASQQDISDTMQAKVASEVMSLEETVLKDNEEKEEVSNEMNTITSKCAEEVRAAKEKLVVAELAIKELKLAPEEVMAAKQNQEVAESKVRALELEM
eukprot:scaffold6146_cov256-Chaetoceros_neogracile.AAC.10